MLDDCWVIIDCKAELTEEQPRKFTHRYITNKRRNMRNDSIIILR